MKTIRMKRADAAAWLAALRSGEYHQGVGMLHWLSMDASIPDTYCCLGVMEKVISGRVENSALPSPEWRAKFGVRFVGRPGAFESAPLMASGLYSSSPWIAEENCVLSTLNDSGKYNFKELADIIEQHIEFTEEVQS